MRSRGGSIAVFAGCMFAGKTERLLAVMRRAERAHLEWRLIKPKRDNRYAIQNVVSHDHNGLPAVVVEHAYQILEELPSSVQVIGIDEGQFFDPEIELVVLELAARDIQVYIAGLDLDYMGLPFGPMPQLMALANPVEKLTAICGRCGADATRTIRIVNGQIEGAEAEVVKVGGSEIYQPRCLRCFFQETRADD